VVCFLVLAGAPARMQDHHPAPAGPAITRPAAALQGAADLIRRGETEEARRRIDAYLKEHPADAEGWYQLARAHLTDFYSKTAGPEKRRISLGLAMEALAAALKQNPDHVYALRAKSVIHARAELLFYDPDQAYALAARVVKLQPYANEFLLNLSEWMSGEVRFTEHSEHRVPHDPQVGLDRSIELLERVVSGAMPFSPEEGASLFLMAKTLSRRGNYNESIEYYTQALARAETAAQRLEVLRELGASQYRRGDFNEAARNFYQALQVQNNPVDQWLLKVAMDQLGTAAPALPATYLFPGNLPDGGAASGFAFRDVAKEIGVDRFDGNGTCSWGDIDNDGDLDLFLAGSGKFLAVYRNEKGKFREVTEEVGLAKVPSGYSLNVIDYDNDGRLDLYVSLNGWSGPMGNRLFRNTGGRFVDVTEKSGAGDGGSGFVSLWGDLDNDGWLDLAIANGVLKDGSTPQIYRNNQDGTFTNMTRAAGIVEPPTYGAIGIALGDYDGDGDLDLLVNGLNDAPNRLYRNDGKWKFTEVSRQAGVMQPAHNGFVCFFLDYNNDGRPDILTTSLAPWEAVVDGLRRGYAPPRKASVHPDASRLFRNNGNGTFTDVTFEAGLSAPMGTMGAGVADLDNDGYVDLYFGTGDPQLSRLEPNRLFRNNGDGTFTDITGVLGFARPGNKGHGVSFVDIDEDGDLDVYAQLGGHYQGDHAYNAFYRNLRGNRNRWLQLELVGTKGNRYAVGAQLTLRAGKLLVHREVKGSEGFGATNPYRVHFGMGAETKVGSLEIRWPGGGRQVLTGLEAGGIYVLREGEEAARRVK
jgi:tetratricopeptide (TPR) repeat protein